MVCHHHQHRDDVLVKKTDFVHFTVAEVNACAELAKEVESLKVMVGRSNNVISQCDRELLELSKATLSIMWFQTKFPKAPSQAHVEDVLKDMRHVTRFQLVKQMSAARIAKDLRKSIADTQRKIADIRDKVIARK